jgi:ankyrin repeat protein
MGACCTATNKKNDRRFKTSPSGVKVDEIPDERSILEDGKPNSGAEKPIHIALRTGNTRLVQELIDRQEINVNDYIFGGSDKTLLHEAVQISESWQVVETVLNNQADVNAVEKETGNTAIILAALDLKVEIVKTILKFNPNINIKNRKGQDIFLIINEYLIEKKGSKKTDLTPEQNQKLQSIIEMLKEYKVKSENVENLDEDERQRISRGFNDSGTQMRNRI